MRNFSDQARGVSGDRRQGTLFGLSWLLHAITGAHEYSSDQVAHGSESVTTLHYVTRSQFWFESLQNWQSEFLAVASIVLL